jgi:hypothetical protein
MAKRVVTQGGGNNLFKITGSNILEVYLVKVDTFSNLPLPQEQLEYLKWYQEIFKSFDYSIRTPKKIEKEIYNRTIEGMKRFGWTRQFVYQTFFIIGDKIPQTNTTDLERTKQEPVPDCECYYDIGCGLLGNCYDGGCNLGGDCGLLGNTDCTGTC